MRHLKRRGNFIRPHTVWPDRNTPVLLNVCQGFKRPDYSQITERPNRYQNFKVILTVKELIL